MTRLRVWSAGCAMLALSVSASAEEPTQLRQAAPSNASDQPVASAQHSCRSDHAGGRASGSELGPERAAFEFIQIENVGYQALRDVF